MKELWNELWETTPRAFKILWGIGAVFTTTFIVLLLILLVKLIMKV